MARLLWWTIS